MSESRASVRPGVYTISVAVLLALAAVSPAVRAEVDVTVERAMTKGPADAPVTIVEFSDYQ